MLEAQRGYRTLLRARCRGMQKDDGVEFSKNLCFISFYKDVFVRMAL
jgi:hypothetical protein